MSQTTILYTSTKIVNVQWGTPLMKLCLVLSHGARAPLQVIELEDTARGRRTQICVEALDDKKSLPPTTTRRFPF